MARRRNAILLVAAAIGMFATGLHAWLGYEEMIVPLYGLPLDAVPRETLAVVWHMASWNMLLMSAALGGLGLSTKGATARERLLALGIAAHYAGYASIFLVLDLWHFHGLWAMPQWTLLGTIAALSAWGALRKAGNGDQESHVGQ